METIGKAQSKPLNPKSDRVAKSPAQEEPTSKLLKAYDTMFVPYLV